MSAMAGGLVEVARGWLTAARAITLKKNSQFYVKRGDIEHLIAQGYLEEVR